jgi:hypothetical protein
MARRVGRIAVGLSATAALLLTGHDAPVEAAANAPVLVELFTSEGCSSCPPADQLLRELDARQDIPGVHVIVLSEHVDYWNHLGWRDPYSSALWTERQEDYRSRLHQPEVYTPQAVVDGTHDVVGSDGPSLRAAIAASARAEKQPLTIVDAEWQGDQVSATLAGGPFRGATVYAVLADERDHSQVAAGENAGHALDHVAVARSLAVIKDGQSRLHLAAPHGASGHLRLIVFAQAKDGRILAGAERTL